MLLSFVVLVTRMCARLQNTPFWPLWTAVRLPFGLLRYASTYVIGVIGLLAVFNFQLTGMFFQIVGLRVYEPLLSYVVLYVSFMCMVFALEMMSMQLIVRFGVWLLVKLVFTNHENFERSVSSFVTSFSTRAFTHLPTIKWEDGRERTLLAIVALSFSFYYAFVALRYVVGFLNASAVCWVKSACGISHEEAYEPQHQAA